MTITGQYRTGTGASANFTGSCTPTTVTAASGLALGGLLGSVASTGTFSCTVSVPVNGTFTASASAGPASYYKLTSGDTAVTLTTSNAAVSQLTGGGFQTAPYLATGGLGTQAKYTAYSALSPALLPAGDTKMHFTITAQSNKNASHLQGEVKVAIRSQCLAAGTGDPSYSPLPGADGLCAYEIDSTLLTSMANLPPTSSAGGYGNIVGTAIVNDVTWPRMQSVLRAGALQVEVYESNGSAPDALGIHVTDSTGKVWFSNNWNNATQKTVTAVAAPQIQGGNLQVH
jgi:hypothetical protein